MWYVDLYERGEQQLCVQMAHADHFNTQLLGAALSDQRHQFV